MNHDLLAILIFIAVGIGLPVVTILFSLILRPRRPFKDPQQATPYESGSLPIGRSRTVGFGYYQYAVLFLLFDIAAVFLILAALAVPVLSVEAFAAIFFFIIFLSLTILYALKAKAFLEI